MTQGKQEDHSTSGQGFEAARPQKHSEAAQHNQVRDGARDTRCNHTYQGRHQRPAKPLCVLKVCHGEPAAGTLARPARQQRVTIEANAHSRARIALAAVVATLALADALARALDEGAGKRVPGYRAEAAWAPLQLNKALLRALACKLYAMRQRSTRRAQLRRTKWRQRQSAATEAARTCFHRFANTRAIPWRGGTVTHASPVLRAAGQGLAFPTRTHRATFVPVTPLPEAPIRKAIARHVVTGLDLHSRAQHVTLRAAILRGRAHP